jgi:hypothetical protein
MLNIVGSSIRITLLLLLLMLLLEEDEDGSSIGIVESVEVVLVLVDICLSMVGSSSIRGLLKRCLPSCEFFV